MSNIQVTHDSSPSNARSESCIAINPNNPMQIVCASKKFSDIQNYIFTLATAFSTDGGFSWHDSPDLAINAAILSDPTLAWDDAGDVFLFGISANNPQNIFGVDAYKSTDGGQSWSGPTRVHSGSTDDKEWAAGDSNPSSPFHGRIYVAWHDESGSTLHFARTKDHGTTWIGAGSKAAGAALVTNGCFSPEINVAADGTVYIVFMKSVAGDTIEMLVSTDGGDSFHAAANPATTIRSHWRPRLAALSGRKLPGRDDPDCLRVRQNSGRGVGGVDRCRRQRRSHLFCAFERRRRQLDHAFFGPAAFDDGTTRRLSAVPTADRRRSKRCHRLCVLRARSQTDRPPHRRHHGAVVRPPGLNTRKASRKTRSLSADRLITQLDMITSTELSGSGMCSIWPLRNSTLWAFTLR